MRGFTFIEILIIIGLISLLAILGFNFVFSFYYQFALEGEFELLINLIKKIRLEALDNLYSLPRGLYFTTSSYIVFSGNNYLSRNSQYDIVYPRFEKIQIIAPFNEIVFQNFSATTSASGTIELKLFDQKRKIIINNEGWVDW